MPNVTLFLGAGASRAFGYPTTADFLKNLRRLDHGHKTVLDGLLRSPQIQDIEHVLQILDILITADSNPYLHANFSKYQPKMPIGAGHQPWAKYITKR